MSWVVGPFYLTERELSILGNHHQVPVAQDGGNICWPVNPHLGNPFLRTVTQGQRLVHQRALPPWKKRWFGHWPCEGQMENTEQRKQRAEQVYFPVAWPQWLAVPRARAWTSIIVWMSKALPTPVCTPSLHIEPYSRGNWVPCLSSIPAHSHCFSHNHYHYHYDHHHQQH